MNTHKRLYDQLQEARDRVSRLEYKLKELVIEDHDPPKTTIMVKPSIHLTTLEVVIGSRWECPDSPFAHCAYNRWKDRAHDECLYCGEPEERK